RGLLDQRTIEALLRVALEFAQARQRLVDVAALALELADAPGDPFESEPVLRRPGRIRLVQAQVLADGVEREAQPAQPLDQGEARAVLVIEDARAAHARWRDQAALLVETDALRRQRELVGELGDAVQARTVGWR